MAAKSHLTVLWTSHNPVTAEKMVLMHTANALARGWREKITLVAWGATAARVCDNVAVRRKFQAACDGVHGEACRSCTEQLGVSETVKALGIEVTYRGKPLTKTLKNGEPLLTV